MEQQLVQIGRITAPRALQSMQRSLNPRAFTFKHKSKQFACVPILKKKAQEAPEELSRPFIRQAFLDVNMINRHWGLAKIAMDAGIDIRALRKKEFVLFVNPERTSVALFGYGGTLTYLTARYSRELGTTLVGQDILDNLSESFTSKGFDGDPALKLFLSSYLRKEKRTRILKP